MTLSKEQLQTLIESSIDTDDPNCTLVEFFKSSYNANGMNAFWDHFRLFNDVCLSKFPSIDHIKKSNNVTQLRERINQNLELYNLCEMFFLRLIGSKNNPSVLRVVPMTSKVDAWCMVLNDDVFTLCQYEFTPSSDMYTDLLKNGMLGKEIVAIALT